MGSGTSSKEEQELQLEGNRAAGYTYCPTVEWRYDWDLNDAVTKFHDKCALQPRSLEDARAMHHMFMFMSEIERKLREANICSRIEYTGSSYDGIKVSKSSTDDDLEFDVMIIMVSHFQDVYIFMCL